MILLKRNIFLVALSILSSHFLLISAQTTTAAQPNFSATATILQNSTAASNAPGTKQSENVATNSEATTMINPSSPLSNITTSAPNNQTDQNSGPTTNSASAATTPAVSQPVNATVTVERSNVSATTESSARKASNEKPDSSSGSLCEDGNDKVGFDLGCDCKILKGVAIADCSNRVRQIGQAVIPLPDNLNVSGQIRVLDLSYNVLEIIGEHTFNEVSGVTDLILSHNEITAVEHMHFPLLAYLDLSFNKITNLSDHVFAHAKKLRYLDLSHNSLTFIHVQAFSSLVYLQTLKLAFNPLENEINYSEAFPFILSNLTYLEELDLSNSSLPNLPPEALEGTNNLKRLLLSNNYIYFLPERIFSKLTQLEELDISGNHLKHLRADDFSGLHNLRKLTIDNSKALIRIDAHAFAGLPNLQTLQCEKNYHLREIDPLAFRGNPETNTSDSNPKVVQLGYNGLSHFEYPLLKWETLEELELYGNPWVCDCSLQWVSAFIRGAPVNATILMDTDFKCTSPDHLKDTPLVEVEPEELQCDSPVAVLAGVIALTIFIFLLILFVITLALYHFQLLPSWIENWLGQLRNRNSLPKYQKVQVPKPSGRRNARLATGRHDPEIPPDLDWDSADVGNAGY